MSCYDTVYRPLLNCPDRSYSLSLLCPRILSPSSSRISRWDRLTIQLIVPKASIRRITDITSNSLARSFETLCNLSRCQTSLLPWHRPSTRANTEWQDLLPPEATLREMDGLVSPLPCISKMRSSRLCRLLLCSD
jgi:hypothetical protein